jgi:cysteinyl-tRNA synthetase
LQVYSTLHRRLVELEPASPGEIGIYVCGATVQSEPHVGHGRYAVVFDVIRRYLIWRGNSVRYVRNITDIDDKIIAAAAAAGETVTDRAKRIATMFDEAYEALGVLPPDIEPRATEHVSDMLTLITTLIERGLAYSADNGDVYFAVRALESYGKLSGRKPEELMAGARVEVSETKNDPLDFALWKSAKPGEPSWESPWGPGRPGWHIECSAMAARYLGSDFAIHGGGNDLIFPHHENEIAQSEGATGQTFARYWLHNGMLNLSGEKMSKSTGRLIELSEAIKRFGGMSLRLFYLRAHYRSPLEFSEELLEGAASSYERLQRFLARSQTNVSAVPDPDLMERFGTAMDHDFGTPEAMALIFDAVAEANRALDAGNPMPGSEAAVREMLAVLGFTETQADQDGISELALELGLVPRGLDDPMASILAARAEARAIRDYARSDLIRERLEAAGIVVEDTADGARWFRR